MLHSRRSAIAMPSRFGNSGEFLSKKRRETVTVKRSPRRHDSKMYPIGDSGTEKGQHIKTETDSTSIVIYEL